MKAKFAPMFVVATLVVGAFLTAASASAQDNAQCPSSGRLRINAPAFPFPAPVPIDKVVYGRLSGGGLYGLVFALGGLCTSGPVIEIDHPKDSLTKLRRDSVICLQGSVEIVSVPTVYNCGQEINMRPLPYDGWRLQTYLGDGNNTFVGGTGSDSAYGGSGADVMSDAAGDFDCIYGEHGGDSLQCSLGTNTFCSGGAGADVVREVRATAGDQLFGGTNADKLVACRPEVMDCGGNDGDRAFTSDTTEVNRCQSREPLLGCQ